MSLKSAILTLIIGAFYNLTVAQETANDSLRQYQLEQIVITGTRLPLEKGRVPSSITVINEEEIESQNQTNVLSTLGARVPGVFVGQRGMVGFGIGPRSGGGISIRGLGTSGDPSNTRTLVLIDGQPQFMGVFGHPINDSYLSSDIERVEVIRGPASILYGSNAMGGVINIITRQQHKDGLSLGGRAVYGSFNTFEADASAGYKKDRFHIMGVFNRVQTEGHRKDADDDFNTTSGYLKTGYRLSNSLNASIDANLAESRFYDPGTIENPLFDNFYDYLRGRVALSIDNTAEKIEGAFRVFYNFGEHNFHDGFHSKDYNRGITFYQNLKFIENNVLTLGTDLKTYGGKAIMQAQVPKNNIDETINETDFYALMQHTFFDDLDINIGIRYVINSEYGNVAVPQYGATYAISKNSRVKASVSKGFRSPTLANLFFAPPSNEELEPEEMWSYELSYLQEVSNKLTLELAGFINKGDNLIRIPGGPPPQQYINTGKFEHWGIEFQGAYAITKSLNFSTNYSYLHVEEPLTFAPKHQLNASLDYSLKGLKFMAELQQTSGLYIGDLGGNRMDVSALTKENFTLLNMQIQYPFIRYLTIYSRVENILDQEYMLNKGYPMPGISMRVGAKFRW